MNLLRKQLGDFAKDRFKAAAQPLFVVMRQAGNNNIERRVQRVCNSVDNLSREPGTALQVASG